MVIVSILLLHVMKVVILPDSCTCLQLVTVSAVTVLISLVPIQGKDNPYPCSPHLSSDIPHQEGRVGMQGYIKGPLWL